MVSLFSSGGETPVHPELEGVGIFGIFGIFGNLQIMGIL